MATGVPWFSSPRWGFLLFNRVYDFIRNGQYAFSSPHWGFFYLINNKLFHELKENSSRPLSGDYFI